MRCRRQFSHLVVSGALLRGPRPFLLPKMARVVREEPRVRVKPQLVAWCSRDTHTHTHPLVDEHLELWKAPKNGVESGKGANGWASTLHAAKGKGRWSVTETLTSAKKNQRKAFSMILWSKNKMHWVTDATSNFMKINRSLRQRQTIQALAGLAPIGGL